MGKRKDRQRAERTGMVFRDGKFVPIEKVKEAESAITELKELGKSFSFDEMRKRLRR